MIELQTLICCEIISRDADTNKLILVNLFEPLEAESFPLFLPSFCVLAHLLRADTDPEKPTGTLSIKAGVTEVLAAPVNIDFKGRLNTRAIARIQGLMVTEPGIVSATFRIDGGVEGSYSFTLGLRIPRIQVSST